MKKTYMDYVAEVSAIRPLVGVLKTASKAISNHQKRKQDAAVSELEDEVTDSSGNYHKDSKVIGKTDVGTPVTGNVVSDDGRMVVVKDEKGQTHRVNKADVSAQDMDMSEIDRIKRLAGLK